MSMRFDWTESAVTAYDSLLWKTGRALDAALAELESELLPFIFEFAACAEPCSRVGDSIDHDILIAAATEMKKRKCDLPVEHVLRILLWPRDIDYACLNWVSIQPAKGGRAAHVHLALALARNAPSYLCAEEASPLVAELVRKVAESARAPHAFVALAAAREVYRKHSKDVGDLETSVLSYWVDPQAYADDEMGDLTSACDEAALARAKFKMTGGVQFGLVQRCKNQRHLLCRSMGQ